MHFTELSGLMAVLWSSLFIVLIYYLRKKGKINQLSEVLCLVFLYLFSVIRMLVPIDFIPSIGINLPGLPSEIYEEVCVIERGTGMVSPTILELLCGLWGIIAIVNLLLYYKKYRGITQWFRTFKRYENIDSVIEKVQKTTGKKIKVEVRKGFGIDSPVGVGIFHKMIILPDRELEQEDLYYILLHECTHFYNYDLIIKLMINVYICCFWWNPIVYLLKKDLERSLEIKCDLRAVNFMTRKEVICYLETIVKVLKGTEDKRLNTCVGIIALAGEREDELTERFRIIIDNQKKEKTLVRTVAYGVSFIALFILSYCFMPMTYYQPQNIEMGDENNILEFDFENTYLYEQENGKYRLIKEGEFSRIINESELEYLKSQGFEIKEEK